MPGQSNFRGLFQLTVPRGHSLPAGKARQQEREADGHIVTPRRLNNARGGAPTGEMGQSSVQKEKGGQVTLKLFNKDSRNHIIFYLPKMAHNVC